jgi:hypothetical protein
MKPRTRNILMVTTIFVAGVVTGALPSFNLGERRAEHRLHIDNLRASLLEILQHELQLNADQRSRIEPIVTESCEQYRRLTLETVDRVGQLVQIANQRIARELTPAQAERLAQLESERQTLVRQKLDRDYLRKDFLAE